VLINNHIVSNGSQPYIIAEMSCNHRQRLSAATRIIEAAAAAGADAIKTQTFTPSTMTMRCNSAEFKAPLPWGGGRTLYDLYEEAFMPWEWHYELKEVAKDLGLDYISSVYDESSLTFLIENVDVDAYKISSFEMFWYGLIKAALDTTKPVIISTGVASTREINDLHNMLSHAAKPGSFSILHCVSQYPTANNDAALQLLKELMTNYPKVAVGLSDHSLGYMVPIAATALGTCIIEKHLTLNRNDDTPDSTFSLEPDEFKNMVQNVRNCWNAINSVKKATGSRLLSRSIYAVLNIKAGDSFNPDNIRIIRPGLGADPNQLSIFMGNTAYQDIPSGTPLDIDIHIKESR